MILRWVLALGLVGLTGYGLLEFKRTTVYWAAEAEDEILAYEVTPTRSAAFELPAGLERVLVSAYGVLSAEAAAERATDGPLEVTYGVIATLTDQQGKPCDSRTYETVSRVPMRRPGEGLPAARLAYSADPVSEPRTLAIDVRSCAAVGGRLELRGSHGDAQRVLLRVMQRQLRAPLERELVARRLGAEKRAEIVEARASLGFEDLPARAQARAVAGWRRRIGALGQRDVDYVQRRLLLRRVQGAPAPETADESVATQVAPGRVMALNLRGAARLRVAADPGQIVTVSEDGQELQPFRVPESGEVVVTLEQEGVRTVEIASRAPADVRLFLEGAAREQLLGEPEVIPISETRLQVSPERRRQRALRLDPEQPLVFRVPPGQVFFGVSLRARLLDSLAVDGALPLPTSIEGKLRARWSTGQTTEARVSLTPSRFDHFGDDHFATEGHTLLLRPPPGAEHLELHGDSILTMLAWTSEPGVEEGRLAPSYRVELEEDQVWRHADYELRSWATIWPENGEEVEVAGRVLDLITQVRLDRRGAEEREPRPERGIPPQGAPLRRRLLTPRLPQELDELDGSWTPFARGRARVDVPAIGASAGLLDVVYRADEAFLGERIGLRVDGATLVEEPLVLLSGRLRAEVAPGAHDVELVGAGDDPFAFAKSPPAAATRALRAHTVFALSPSQPLSFVIDEVEPEPTLLVVVLATEGKQALRLRYTVDGGVARRKTGTFYRRTTEDHATVAVASGDEGTGLLWEVERPAARARSMPDGIAKVRIPLGDDLRPGRHMITVQLLGATPTTAGGSVRGEPTVWARAVLVGSEARPGEADTRWWAAEVDP